MTERLRWAILSTGSVANRFAKALGNISDQAELVAVGSRQQATADAFGEKYGIPRRYGSYEALAADPDIDIVYLGTPHTRHHADMLLCLEAGKHVLCEKAFAMNAAEAREAVALARRKGLFLMEAMWTRFFPIHVCLREMLAEGAIGTLEGLLLHQTYIYTAGDGTDRPDVKTGLGTLMDQAPYAVGMAMSVLGPIEEVAGLVTVRENGVSQQTFYALRHRSGAMTSYVGSRIGWEVKDMVVYGLKGKIEIHEPWYKPTAMTLYVEGKAPQRIEMPLNGYIGYEYEALAVMDCIRAGKLESEVMPLDETIRVLAIMDQMREQDLSFTVVPGI